MADSDTPDDLLLAAARALWAWNQAEIQLVNLFTTLSGMDSAKKAYAVFDTVVSFETRADLLDTLMAGENLTPLEHETWTRFSRKIRKHYKKRHELAHFNILSTSINGGPQEHRFSPFMTIGGLMRDESRYLSIKEIQEREAGFRELIHALIWFFTDAMKRRGLPSGPPWPDPPIIVRLMELAAQILEERARKQQSPQA